jgi:hypothetical protein
MKLTKKFRQQYSKSRHKKKYTRNRYKQKSCGKKKSTRKLKGGGLDEHIAGPGMAVVKADRLKRLQAETDAETPQWLLDAQKNLEITRDSTEREQLLGSPIQPLRERSLPSHSTWLPLNTDEHTLEQEMQAGEVVGPLATWTPAEAIAGFEDEILHAEAEKARAAEEGDALRKWQKKFGQTNQLNPPPVPESRRKWVPQSASAIGIGYWNYW